MDIFAGIGSIDVQTITPSGGFRVDVMVKNGGGQAGIFSLIVSMIGPHEFQQGQTNFTMAGGEQKGVAFIFSPQSLQIPALPAGVYNVIADLYLGAGFTNRVATKTLSSEITVAPPASGEIVSVVTNPI